jgi:4-hydroxybenzoate polyprenyltransferase
VWVRFTYTWEVDQPGHFEQPRVGLWGRTKITLEMIKWEHSIFALPFALTGALLAANGLPSLGVLGWILVCMISARSAAMAFNRWADATLDAANPRTRMRAIPAGQLTANFVLAFIVAMIAVFVFASSQLNRLTLILSPVALLVLLGYSYMKRVTRWSHLILGLALGIAPSAAWIAVRGSLDWRIVILTAVVTCWVGGFDILYACQDFEHDREVGLHSIPQAVGVEVAFWIARGLHLTAVLLLGWLAAVFHFGISGWVGISVVGLLLLYEHLIVSPRDLRRLNAAFFTMNGVIAMVFMTFVSLDLWLHHGARLN